MNTLSRHTTTAVVVFATVAVLAGCTGGGTDSSGSTFTLALPEDPGILDPQISAASDQIQLARFAYDTLVGIDNNGETQSQLASTWEVDGTTVTLTLNEGITCSDDSVFTAETAAANLNWVSDPENLSPALGTVFPAGATAEASGNDVIITLATPAPFVLQGLAKLPMVCEAAIEDRDVLAAGSLGTGPYVLTEAVPNDHYTYEINPDYAWGPDGATTSEEGLPATIVARVIPDETTAANLVLSGEINAASIVGPDQDRLAAAGLFTQDSDTLTGEQWYNQGEGHITVDPVVRKALTQALDLAELQNVLTSGAGAPATRLTVDPPVACTYDAVSGSIPETDVDGAKAALDAAGWVVGADGIREKDGVKLSLVFLYAGDLGNGGTAAAELAVAAWNEIGVQVDAQQNDTTTITTALFGTGAWDIALVPINVSNPDQIVGFVSGPAAPNGTNFANIQNAAYEAGVAEAMALNGTDSCDTWKAAETELYKASDVVIFANSVIKTFGNGAEFELIGEISATSIRMAG
jgi:peptide/nickel transport system substrate-binding protein